MTPAGICLVYNKALDYTLVGPGYRTPVSYWMPFNGAVGFHDAWWRGAFGGNICEWDGSHGCVNMPVDMAEKAFDLITSQPIRENLNVEIIHRNCKTIILDYENYKVEVK
jgi:hypothetical protein